MANTQDSEPAGLDKTGVPHARFSVDSVLERDRFDVWRDSISCIFEVEASSDVRNTDFHAEIDANMFGPIMLARTETTAQRWSRTPSLMAKDGMDHYMIQLYEYGNTHWDTNSESLKCPERGLIVYDLTQAADLKTKDFANLSLIIPRDLLEDQLSSSDDQHMRVLDGAEPMVQLFREHIMSLRSLATQMTTRQALEVAPSTAGLAAACLNGVESENPNQQRGVSVAQMTLVRRFIEANLSELDLTADWIAKRTGISRSKLYVLFESYGGVSTFIRDRRMRQALLTLVDQRNQTRSIYDVALQAGYASDSTFSRAFRSRFGASPNEVRNGVAMDRMNEVNRESLDRRYEGWLQHLSV